MNYILSPLRPTHLGLKKMLILVLITMLVGLAFGAVYESVSQFISPLWVAAAVFHTLLTVFILLKFSKQRLSETTSFVSTGSVSTKFLYAPSVVVLLLVLFAILFSSFHEGAPLVDIDWTSQLAFVLWIPIVEEVVFRSGIGGSLQRVAPGIWGIWFSSIIFAWAHTSPSLAGLLGGFWGLPLGPFLLGLICEYLRVAGGSIVPAIAFHMVCNSTVVIFSLFDARWMNWLSWLYM